MVFGSGPAITPRLVHPQKIELRQVDRAGTSWDPHFREATGDVAHKDAVELVAQVSYKKYHSKVKTKDGDIFAGDGYLLFRVKDLADAGITLDKDDKITKISDHAVEYYIIDLPPMGHYDRNYFVKAVFERRMEGLTDARFGGVR